MRRIACFLAIGLFVVSAWNHAAAAAEVTIRLVRDKTASEVFQPGVELDELELAESPVIAGRDIVTFDWQTRTLEIRRECWAVMESLLKVDSRRPSGLAKPFVLSVGNGTTAVTARAK